VGRHYHDDQIEQAVETAMWFPAYRDSSTETDVTTVKRLG
jgi:hypothetical protein